MDTRKLQTHLIRTEAQARAIASPLRLEILGLFTAGHALSVKEISERMGRPPSAIHYHVGILEDCGLLKKAGERKDGRRIEALYLPIADVFMVPGKREGVAAGNDELALKTMSTAFRMAERDMRAALTSDSSRSTGKYRNTFGTRLHCRLGRKELAELNAHIDAIQKTLTSSLRRTEIRDDDEFVSLTLALLPLLDREAKT